MKVTYQVRLHAGLFRDHYEVDDFTKEFDDKQEAIRFHELCLNAMTYKHHGPEWWFSKYLTEPDYGVTISKVVSYTGLWKITEEKIG